MPADQRLKVVLCWHMHQPQYRDLISNEYQLPWTYLHAIKDYIDMAVHIEAVPRARAVVNFAPLLLEQIADYSAQVDGFLTNGVAIRDPLLAALERPPLPVSTEERVGLIKACLRANETRLINRFPAYRRLAHIASWLIEHPEASLYIEDVFLSDLVTWYHLAWLGETVRRSDDRVRELIKKGMAFTLHDRRTLMQVISEILRDIVPRYRRLAEAGKVELSVTPYAHPMLPLLLEFQSAREAMPEVRLPLLERYPGGEARARAHIRESIAMFEKHFGFRPTGCWPAEGGVSDATLRLLEENGFQWSATGQNVLRNTLSALKQEATARCLHKPWRLVDCKLACFFRDDGLSDLIGFRYSDWHADDAVSDLVKHLENIAIACNEDADESVVPIILDGENAWEYYPENGFYFLSALYTRLSSHPRLELTTFSHCLETATAEPLPRVVAGSWVHGTFSTWIGDPDKNRGWDMLGEAKRAYDEALASGRLSDHKREAAMRQLAVCEGSDWFWWFGDYNPADTVSDFDRLYRLHLANLYQLIGNEPPQYLSQAFTHGRGAPALGGVMRTADGEARK